MRYEIEFHFAKDFSVKAITENPAIYKQMLENNTDWLDTYLLGYGHIDINLKQVKFITYSQINNVK